MTLADLVDGLDDQDPDATIYARPGDVGADTPVTVVVEADNGTPPAGLRPVLEVLLAQEAVEVCRAWRDGREPTTADGRALRLSPGLVVTHRGDRWRSHGRRTAGRGQKPTRSSGAG